MDIDKLTQKLAKALNRETNALEERLKKVRSMKDALNGISGPVSGNGRKKHSNGRKKHSNGRKKHSNGRKKHHTMSMAGRRAIARAQRLRWKKIKAEK